MKGLPKEITEEQFLEAINNATSLLAYHFKFGFFDVEDIKQEAAIFALEAIQSGKYDSKQPLPNFLYVHIKNRLINLKRNKYKRNDPPCQSCHSSSPGHTTHPDRQYCKKYENWFRNNVSKQSLMCPLDIGSVMEEKPDAKISDGSEVTSAVETDELLNKVNRELPVELRSDYLKMRAGQSVPKAIRDKIESVVLNILKDSIDG